MLSKNKKVTGNAISLLIAQILVMAFPLITFPYLIRVLGDSIFGEFVFCTTLLTYAQTVIDYNFNIYGSINVSKNKNSKKKIGVINSKIYSTKLFLFLLSFLILIISRFFFIFNISLYIFYFVYILFQTLVPTWFYQGIQETYFLSFLNIFSKLITLILIFLFVKKGEDLIYVAIFYSIGSCIYFFISFFYMFTKYKVYFFRLNIKNIRENLLEGKHLFLSELKAILFTNSSVLILGILNNNSWVALYSISEKLIRAISSLQIPITNALLPHFVLKLRENKPQAFLELKKLSLIFIVVLICLLLPVFYYSDEIIFLIYGKTSLESSIVLKILLLVPIATVIDSLFGKQVILASNNFVIYNRIMTYLAFFGILIVFIFTFYFSIYGTAIGVVISQFGLAIFMFLKSKKIVNKI